MVSGPIELVVQADDFGMCHAVNDGVARAVREGIVTQVVVMAPCPWFEEAVVLAAELDVPVGLHQTLTCEWDFLRWAPLTDAPSLTAADGTMYRRLPDVEHHADPDETVHELLAQAERARLRGIFISHLDVHMGMVTPAACGAVSEQLGVPFLYPGLATSLEFDSIAMLSHRAGGDKKAWLLQHLRRLQPGRHLLVTHPAVGGPELSSITSPESSPWRWAEEFRISDLDVLTDSEVHQTLEELGIRLTSV